MVVARRTVVLTFAMAVAVVPIPRAIADEWGSQDGDTGAHPDENPHTFCFSGSFPHSGLRTNVNTAAADALAGPTDANVVFHSSCTLSGSQETDVVWYEADLPSALGKAPCDDDELLSNHCDQYNVTLDLAAINNGEHDGIHQVAIACHELGHTVGLSHLAGTCMMDSWAATPNTGLAYRRYDSSHHVGYHINGWFS